MRTGTDGNDHEDRHSVQWSIQPLWMRLGVLFHESHPVPHPVRGAIDAADRSAAIDRDDTAERLPGIQGGAGPNAITIANRAVDDVSAHRAVVVAPGHD